jgi:RHS repeat-associated protein
VRRSVDPAGTPPAVIEHYALEGGRRTLALDAAGNVKQRYAYAPSGEVLVDQAFATSGAETQLTTPLADHQGSPRILYGGASNSAPAVRQSVDYAPFGRVTEIRDAAGQVTTSALDAAFGHHGSLLDQDTGLQLKGARWYSADLGRFVSVDPIHDGSNWYAFAGNDPINQSDPTGLKAVWTDPRSTLSGPNVGGPSVLNSFGANAPGYRTSAPRSTPLASAPLTAPGYKLQSKSFDTSLRTPPVDEGARLAAATALAGRWNAVTTKQYSAQHAVDTLPKKIAFYENVQKTYNRGSTSGSLYHARQQLAIAQKALPELVTKADALAAEYSRRGFDSVNYVRFTPGEQVVGGQGLANVANAVAWGGPVRGIEPTESPFDFAAGFATGVLQGSLRGTVGAVAERQAGAGVASLPVLDAQFTPNGTRVLQNLTNQQNALLAADISRAGTVLREAEIRAAAGNVGIAKAQYGNAVERLVAGEIEADPVGLGSLFRHNTGKGPDFFGRGTLQGQIFDITTPGQVGRHLARPYGQNLNIITYDRPAGFP